jgi:hypothetical protein
MDLIWGKREEIYFCNWGWTAKAIDLPARQVASVLA